MIELKRDEIEELVRVNEHDWGDVEPSIFGTLFERTLDPGKRSQIGAHYTSREDILTLLEPVVMAPLRREWEEVQAKCDKLWEKVKKVGERSARAKGVSKERAAFEKPLKAFVERLAHVRILDPACGSGNFLYAAINLLLDLEKEVIAYGAAHGVGLLPQVRPTQLAGIEINPYAQQLAQVVIWIGYLQWMQQNGFNAPRDPVLEPIESIRLMDAILDLSDPEHPKEPEWPEADFIVGNPPFLGGKRILSELGETYVASMRRVWDSRISHFGDLCCYWFEKARQQIADSRCERAGLLATQGIRGGANREVLNRIKDSGAIFFAESDRDWVLDGAMVHVSMVGFDGGNEKTLILDGASVPAINSNLTVGADTTRSRRLPENEGRAFIGVQKSGPFDVSDVEARSLLSQPSPSGKPTSDVMRIYWTAVDMVRRPLNIWVIDFVQRTQEEAAQYGTPFELLKDRVPESRAAAHFQEYPFWQLWRPRGEMYQAIAGLERYIVTPHVSKHRLFSWADVCCCPSNLLIAIASDSDVDFGILQSRCHEVWALALGTQLRERESGFRYTSTTCFETFPFPKPTDEQRAAIAAAACELDRLRSNWLNPPEWTREEVLEFPGSVDGPWARYVHKPNQRGIGTVRYPRIVPRDEECAGKLKKRTLTNLYNERPTWLDLAHRRLDEAVFAAYGWPADLTDDVLLANLLELNLHRANAESDCG